MVKAAFAKTSPIAFMRGLTFPGGQQPVIRGEGVYLRYPRGADYPVWARLRAESRQFIGTSTAPALAQPNRSS